MAEIKCDPVNPDFSTYPYEFKWRSTVENSRVIRHSSRCHVASSSWSLIAIWSDGSERAT